MKELIRSIKNILQNQQGYAIAILFAIILPIIIFACISTIEMTNVVQAGDMDIQEGVVLASKAATEQVDMNLHAQGIFQISPDRAINTFRKELSRNVGLNETTLAPMTEAYTSTPKYCVLVYNGTVAGDTANKLYVFDGSTTTYSTPAITGFPQSFVIDGDGLNILAGSGTGAITLTEPGVIAVIKIDQKDLLADSNLTLTRWAAATIKKVN